MLEFKPDGKIVRIRIPYAHPKALKDSLFRHQIHEGTMLPDLDGLTRHIESCQPRATKLGVCFSYGGYFCGDPFFLPDPMFNVYIDDSGTAPEHKVAVASRLDLSGKAAGRI